ncbi:hypothetical protein MPDQ_000412 [Monascus purpureus]|uniref:Uncharacterized protein n=1 Tax=Monascus purpureus TaxID=5098 RepID=A0A507QTY0_MONPU|nr:hypothetical protein MPDQ_000412 [Monascus purpureus]BDD58325.1 hypothetical protein MAP00_003611 [Monascus purpureus]
MSTSLSYYSTSPPRSSNPHFDYLSRRRQQKKMSLTQTYYLAHTARKKLTTQAARADHDLRLLVGHANLLDTLMLELSDAEHEQERWFNQTVSGASQEEPQHRESVVEDPEDDWNLEDISDADSDVSDDSYYDEEDFLVNTLSAPIPCTRTSSSPSMGPIVTEQEVDEDSDSEFEEDDLEDLEELVLTRTPSRQHPPELASDSDEESDEDQPPTPTQMIYNSFDIKQAVGTTKLALPDSDQSALLERYVSRPEGAVIEAF